MFKSLNPGAVGIKASFEEVLQLAAENGFDGVHVDMGAALEMGPTKMRALLQDKGLKPSAWGFPVDVQHDQDKYEQGMERLRALAPAARELGCPRTSTWIYPFSDERAFKENFELYVSRLKPAARILQEHDCRLGLEFVGPKTSRAGHKYEFIHTLEGMLELCAAVGANVGLLLDSWHWYTAHGTAQQLAKLTDKDVVDVHVNDAPAGVAVDEQIDNVRRMPGQTGVIDIAGFLQGLAGIRYTGPVMVEPFSDEVRGLSPSEAARLTAQSLRKIWDQAGV